jgi:hypothetical protein
LFEILRDAERGDNFWKVFGLSKSFVQGQICQFKISQDLKNFLQVSGSKRYGIIFFIRLLFDHITFGKC